MTGFVAAGDHGTAEAGAALLREGGNAVDAVIAAACASFICEPLLSSAGGAGVATCGSADRGFFTHDFFTLVPGLGLAARPALDFQEITIDFGPTTQDFHVGRGAAAVPTALFGLLAMHKAHGRAPLSDVFAPAIHLCRDGHVLSSALQWVTGMLRPIVEVSDGVRSLLSSDGELAPADRPIHNRALGDFLEALGEEGEALLRGPFTDALVAAFGPENGGLLTRQDLAQYSPRRRPPLRVDFDGHTLLTTPPPSAGGTLIGVGARAGALANIGRHPFMSEAHIDALVDVLATISVARRADIDARIRARIGNGMLFDDADIARWRATAEGIGEERNLGGTTHISVKDAAGMCASMTLTNGEGCGHALPGFGVHINNFLGEEDINPAGFHALPAGTPMTTMMAPAIVLRGHEPTLVVGSGGSNRIRSVITQTVLHATLLGQDLPTAIRAPRLHIEGGRLWFERCGMPDDSVDLLLRRFPEASVFDAPNMFFGGVHCVGSDTAHGDERRGGAVVKVP